MNFLVTSPTDTNWKMAPEQFISRLIERWPQARIRERGRNRFFSHDWTIQMPSGELVGRLGQDPCGVSIEGDFEDCAAFALWFRSLAPSSVPLLFYDDCFNQDIALTDQTTVTDIVAAFS